MAASASKRLAWALHRTSNAQCWGTVRCCPAAPPRRALAAAAAVGDAAAAGSTSGGHEGTPLDAYIGPPGRRLQLMEQRYSLLGGDDATAAAATLSLIAPLDVDAVLDLLIERAAANATNDDSGDDPYWTRAWPSALALAQVLLARPELIAGRRVLDLGCGLGIAGLAAALAGAQEVVLVDREPLALACAALSAAASGLGAADVAPEVAADLPLELIAQLADRRAPSSSSTSTSSPIVRVRRFDWNADGLPGDAFDVVLACDVLYEAAFVKPIATLVPRLLRRAAPSSGGGLLLLADPTRRTATNRERFVQLLSRGSGSNGFMVEECREVACQASQLDREMSGGVTRGDGDGGGGNGDAVVPITFMALRRAFGGDTVGVKFGG